MNYLKGLVDILTEADLIPEEDVVVTLTKKGYIKRVPVTVNIEVDSNESDD